MAMTRIAIVIGVLAIAGVMAGAQSTPVRNISGAWVPMGGGRGADPKIAPPPATPIVLKAEYAKAYETRRTTEAAAVKKGEPVATPAILCLPYGMPRMMTVASYPIE